MGKSEQAIMKKLQRLGLKVVQLNESNRTTTSELILPKELFSVEESLMMLAGAMKALEVPGLSKTEVMRLRSLVQAASVYQVKYAEYVDYRGLEKELIEVRKKISQLIKRKEIVTEKPLESMQENGKPTKETGSEENAPLAQGEKHFAPDTSSTHPNQDSPPEQYTALT